MSRSEKGIIPVMRWLITGGTGSFAKHLIVRLRQASQDVTVFSRDEHKQNELRRELDDTTIRFVVGDVRDREAVFSAASGHSRIVHTAALKHVRTGQEQPREIVKTNLLGTMNVVDAANGVGANMVLLSTDKAVQPVNYYGASKMLAEGITLNGGQRVVRYGNVFGSRGSVLHTFGKQQHNGHFTITDHRMTRFVVTFEQAVDLALDAIEAPAGTLKVARDLPAMRIIDLAHAFNPDADFEEIGIQPGEKLAEALDYDVTSDKARMLTVEEIRGMIDAAV